MPELGHILQLDRIAGEVRVTLCLGQPNSAPQGWAVDSEAVDKFIERGDGLFDGKYPPSLNEIILLGKELAHQVLGPLFKTLAYQAGTLWVTSADPHLLHLPFELLPDPERDNEFFIQRNRLSFRRATHRDVAIQKTEPSNQNFARPVRILFMVSAPEDESRLAYEKEEQAIIAAVCNAGDRVEFRKLYSGTFDELKHAIISFRPHIVHLSGHATVFKGTGYFLFEDTFGKADPRDSKEIAGVLFGRSGVSLAFLSGCNTGAAHVMGVCQELVNSGHVPLVLGWAFPVFDDLATYFAATLLKELSANVPIDHAIDQARIALLTHERSRSSANSFRPDFALPRLFASSSIDQLINQFTPPDDQGKRQMVSVLMDDNIEALSVGSFVGRRRMIERIRPQLVNTFGKRILLLTGASGVGKSALASLLVNALESEGWRRICLQLRDNEAPERLVTRLLSHLHTEAVNSHLDSPLVERLLEPFPFYQRFAAAILILNQLRIILMLDNLESMMPHPPVAPSWTNTDFGVFVEELIYGLTGESRVILTCRYVPALLQSKGFQLLCHEPVPDLTTADFNKYMEYHPQMRAFLATGRISKRRLTIFHQRFGATPGFLKEALPLLAKLKSKQLSDFFKALSNGNSAQDHHPILTLQRQYLDDLLLPKLYQSLIPSQRRALSRLAVSEMFLPPEAVSVVADVAKIDLETTISAWLHLGLIQRLTNLDQYGKATHFYTIYPLHRTFLTNEENLDAEIASQAHKALANLATGVPHNDGYAALISK